MIRDLGGRAEEQQEGFTVYGGLSGGTVFGAGDHRIVMASAVASAVCPVTIEGAEAVSKSYPGFFEDLSSLGCECSFEE
jgi:3-phosphoshikimate 1-carboxyvinyltransferase